MGGLPEVSSYRDRRNKVNVVVDGFVREGSNTKDRITAYATQLNHIIHMTSRCFFLVTTVITNQCIYSA